MTAIATGVFKTVAYKKQTGVGVIATGGGATGQYIRRVKSTVDLKKATYKSAEILVSQQRRDFRHGVRSVSGTISGEVSVGGYQNFMESICRQVVQAVTTTGALTNVTAAATTGAQGTMTRAAGSFLTDGFKLGDVVNQTGWTTTGSGDNNRYAIIVALTATVMTLQYLDGNAMASKASGDSVTTVTVGKKTWIPTSGQTRDYYTIEHWFGDISQSEVFQDCVISKMSVKMPPTGMATIDFDVMGLNIVTNTVQYFSSPAAQPTGGIEAAVNGLILVQGAVAGIITGFNFDITGNYSAPGGVVGQNTDPDIFPGSIDATGQMTVLFQNATFRDYFVNETEVSAVILMTSGGTAAQPGFTSFVLPRVKFGGADKDDQEKGLTLTVPFTAIEQINGGAGTQYLDTTVSIQDSAFS